MRYHASLNDIFCLTFIVTLTNQWMLYLETHAPYSREFPVPLAIFRDCLYDAEL